METCHFLVVVLLMAALPAAALPARVILLRHAEKPPGESDVHLSERGEARARALVGFFATGPVGATNALPAALFAPKFTGRGRGIRPYETLGPLAQHLHLPVQMPYGPAGYAELARQILGDPLLDGKTAIVCWVHDYLPELAKAFGVAPKPERWKGSVYDRVWVITYRKHRATLVSLPQKLLPGDASE